MTPKALDVYGVDIFGSPVLSMDLLPGLFLEAFVAY